MAPLPSQRTVEVLRWAVTDKRTVARYRSKIRSEPAGCHWWTGALTSKGHGRLWLCSVDGRDVGIIAHRFSWALEHGVDALVQARVLGHKCDNPLCQRLGPDHVRLSSSIENRKEWANRRHTIGNPLRDRRGARARAVALRDALRDGHSFDEVAQLGLLVDADQLALWPSGEPAHQGVR